MNVILFTILKNIVAEHGDFVLSQPKRVAAFLADRARDVPKPQKNALVKSLELRSAEILKNAEKTELSSNKQNLAKKLHEEEGFDLGLCMNTLELLSGLLFNKENNLAGSAVNTTPGNMITLRRDAFRFNQLTDVTIPENVNIIGEGAFAVNQLTNVTIPNKVIIIGEKAFFKNQLVSVALPISVTSVGPMAFANNQLASIIIPNSVIIIGREAFAYNKLVKVIISKNITAIEPAVFAVNQLTSITIPNNVTVIGSGAFAENHLTSITIGKDVEIANKAFDNEFDIFYNSQGRRPGNYTFINGRWKV